MTSAADRQLVVAEFDTSLFPSGSPSLGEAWVGIYQVLWWHVGDPVLMSLEAMRAGLADEPAEVIAAAGVVAEYLREAEGEPVLHVREANDLRKPVWKKRAAAAASYIAGSLGVDAAELPVLFDRMMRLPRWEGKQRQNPLGNGLRVLVCESLRRWGSAAFDYEEETLATDWFPSIKMPGRSTKPRVDVAATKGGDPRAIISCKWSIRHDRISDPTNECQEYMAAAVKRQLKLSYYVVTNELDWQRLEKVLSQPCVDALVHVHLGLVEHLMGGTSAEMQAAKDEGRILDLTDFVTLTHGW